MFDDRLQSPTPRNRPSAPPQIGAALDELESWLRIERGLADRSVAAYLSDLRLAEAYLTDNGARRLKVSDLGSLELKDFLAHLRDDRQFRPRSLARAMSSLRLLCDFCVQRGWMQTSPATGLKNPKIPRKIPVFLTPDEIRELLRAPDRTDTDGWRDYAILVTFLYTGMRLSEVVGLNIGDIDFSGQTLLVRGKGSKERLLPLHDAVGHTLRAYLDHHHPSPGGREWAVFLDKDGQRMTARMVGYAVTRSVKKAGLSHRITPHKLRHTFATQLLHSGANLMEIKELLGHSQIATTSIYTHTTVERLKKAVNEIGE